MPDDELLVQAPAHVRAAIVGSSLLLLDLELRFTTLLTGGPALVWTSTTGAPIRVSEIAEGISADVGGSVDEHLEPVRNTVGVLLQQGLLVDARDLLGASLASPPGERASASWLDAIRASMAARSGPALRLSTGTTVTELVGDDAALTAFLADALSPLRTDAGSARHQIAVVGTRRSDLPFRLVVDGRIRHRAATRNELLRQVMFELNALARSTGGDAVALHGGAVELDGRVLLIVGESGTGKSTLTAALLQRGARYVTDEVAVVRLPSGEVAPFPKPIDLAPASWELLGIESADHVGADDDLQKDPLRVTGEATSGGGVVTAILELGTDPSDPDPIDGPEARATTAVRHAFREPFETPAGDDLLQRLVDRAATTTMVHMGRAGLADAVEVAFGLLARPPTTPVEASPAT